MSSRGYNGAAQLTLVQTHEARAGKRGHSNPLWDDMTKPASPPLQRPTHQTSASWSASTDTATAQQYQDQQVFEAYTANTSAGGPSAGYEEYSYSQPGSVSASGPGIDCPNAPHKEMEYAPFQVQQQGIGLTSDLGQYQITQGMGQRENQPRVTPLHLMA